MSVKVTELDWFERLENVIAKSRRIVDPTNPKDWARPPYTGRPGRPYSGQRAIQEYGETSEIEGTKPVPPAPTKSEMPQSKDVPQALRMPIGRPPSEQSQKDRYDRMKRHHQTVWQSIRSGAITREQGEKLINQARYEYETGDVAPPLPHKMYALVDARKGPEKWGEKRMLHQNNPATFYRSPEHIPQDIPHHGLGVVEVDTHKLPELLPDGEHSWTTEMHSLPEGSVTGFQTLRNLRQGGKVGNFEKGW